MLFVGFFFKAVLSQNCGKMVAISILLQNSQKKKPHPFTLNQNVRLNLFWKPFLESFLFQGIIFRVLVGVFWSWIFLSQTASVVMNKTGWNVRSPQCFAFQKGGGSEEGRCHVRKGTSFVLHGRPFIKQSLLRCDVGTRCHRKHGYSRIEAFVMVLFSMEG